MLPTFRIGGWAVESRFLGLRVYLISLQSIGLYFGDREGDETCEIRLKKAESVRRSAQETNCIGDRMSSYERGNAEVMHQKQNKIGNSPLSMTGRQYQDCCQTSCNSPQRNLRPLPQMR
jgi:5-deoxy-D-glucuronate isomerase